MNEDTFNRSADALVKSLDLKIKEASQLVEALKRETMPAAYADRRAAELRILKAKEDLSFWQYLKDHAPVISSAAVDKTEDNTAETKLLPCLLGNNPVEVTRN